LGADDKIGTEHRNSKVNAAIVEVMFVKDISASQEDETVSQII
jgi:hypothetical protein